MTRLTGPSSRSGCRALRSQTAAALGAVHDGGLPLRAEHSPSAGQPHHRAAVRADGKPGGHPAGRLIPAALPSTTAPRTHRTPRSVIFSVVPPEKATRPPRNPRSRFPAEQRPAAHLVTARWPGPRWRRGGPGGRPGCQAAGSPGRRRRVPADSCRRCGSGTPGPRTRCSGQASPPGSEDEALIDRHGAAASPSCSVT